MKYRFKFLALLCALFLVIGCGDKPAGGGDVGGDTSGDGTEVDENTVDTEDPGEGEGEGEEEEE